MSAAVPSPGHQLTILEGDKMQPGAASVRQVLEQPSPLFVFPSSHTSTPVLTKPSPQTLNWQLFLQASVFIIFPSSHCSPLSIILFPHTIAGGCTPLHFPA